MRAGWCQLSGTDGGGVLYYTCERAAADGPCEHARQIEHADSLERILDVPGIGKHALGRLADFGYEHGVDVGLVYPVRRHVHLLERAQRSGAEVSLQHDCLELFRGPLCERGRDGLLGGPALQDVEDTLFVAGGVCTVGMNI